MTAPRLLDLFCGAGGAAMGYRRAGFEVVGVDIKPQKRFPFEFIQADALSLDPEFVATFDAIHASPPCQRYSRLRHLPWLKDREYWDSIPPTRAFLESVSIPWVIENVEDAPLGGITLCGQQFGLPIFRHRKFEASFALEGLPHAKHSGVIAPGRASMAKRYTSGSVGIKEVSRDSIGGHFAGVARARLAMGIEWMTRDELSQAIPPAYTEFIGRQLISQVREVAE